ncbi:MAG: polymerase subunit delta [Patescibacteria group bacterium]|nr:polymerase subunit delta [Patescibacteria group bacterium]
MLTHHAYFLEGALDQFDALVHALRESENFAPHDPGFAPQQFEKFGIDEARELIATASLKNTGGRTLFVLGVGSMTSEAQQALLKLFEEPQQGTQFVLLLPHGTLLSTLRSRMLDFKGEVVDGSKEFLPKKSLPAGRQARARLFSSETLLAQNASSGQFVQNDATEFLASPYKKRSDWVAAFLKDEEDARERTRSFFTELEAALHPHMSSANVRAALEDLMHLRQYLNDRAPSLKMILEHLAVTLPAIK